MYVHSPHTAIFQSPVGSTKKVKTSQGEETRIFYAEIGQGSQACREASYHPDD